MCGIFGHATRGAGLDRARAALHTLSHRGPDQWRDWHDAHVYLGHRRLSILDLSEAGRQPMADAAGEIVVTVNGEVYNFRTLRAELEKKHAFFSGSDSEVILHGYREWGLDGLLARLEGMYAFAIYDARTRQVHLVRDRVGIKPLYYSLAGGGLAWGSELKALRAFLEPALTVDETALYDFLTYKYVPGPKSLYREVAKLLPGHALTVDLDEMRPRLRRYWALPTDTVPIGVDEAAAELRRRVARAVDEQLVADVPLGFFLSGGLDSSTVVAEAARIATGAATYAIGFDVASHDETGFAALVAQAYGTDHHMRRLGAEGASDLFARLAAWYDEPFADLSALPTFLVSAFARESRTVVLSGDGGDEVFGGYSWYRRYAALSRRPRRAFAALRPVAAGLKHAAHGSLAWKLGTVLDFEYALRGPELYAKLMGGMVANEKGAYRRAWGIPADYDDYWFFRQHWRDDLPLMTRLQYVDFHTFLPDDVLTKVDRASMQVSLEVRVPLLATELVEFAFRLPEEVRYADGALKGLLKRAYAGELPPEILSRGKKGFSIPAQSWRATLPGGAGSNAERVLRELFAAESAAATAQAGRRRAA